MATGKVSKRTVDELTTTTRETFLWDAELRGFGVKVSRTGTKTYVYQYRMGGRESSTRRYSIGKHGSPWTPTTARKEAERIAILIAQGIDPNALSAEHRRQNTDLAFQPYAERFLASCSGDGWRRMVERTLRLHVVPHWRRRPLNTIGRSDISALIDRIPITRLALRRDSFAVIRRLFRWSVSRGDIDRSPCEGMETPKAVIARDRALAFDELIRVWKASFFVDGPFGPIVRLLISTGQRREEVTGLKWSEIIQHDQLWTLPKERSKNGIAHRIPLNKLTREILTEQAGSVLWPRSGLIFSTSRGNKFCSHAKGKKKIDLILSQDGLSPFVPWRLHDLRRSLATGFQKLGVRFEVTEAVLNHLSGHRSGVAAVYQTHDWDDEKRAALAGWAKELVRFLDMSIVTAGDTGLYVSCCAQLALQLGHCEDLQDVTKRPIGTICRINNGFGIVGESSIIEVKFCPWCGDKLEPSA